MLHEIGVPFQVIWKPRWCKSAMSADLASRLSPWKCTVSLQKQIETFFNINFSDLLDVYKPVYLARLTSLDVPLQIEKLMHYKQPLLLFIPPNLPRATYLNIWHCFSKFPIKGIAIVPALHFSQWFQGAITCHKNFFDIPIKICMKISSLSLLQGRRFCQIPSFCDVKLVVHAHQ